MSALMLSDENALNQINPFVVDGPGGWSKPYGFAPSLRKDRITCDAYGCSITTETGDKWEPKLEKPNCTWGITALSNGSLDAPSCFPPKNPVSCPLSRPAEPTQEFLPDLYTLIPYKDPLPRTLEKEREKDISLPVIGIAVILITLLMIAKR